MHSENYAEATLQLLRVVVFSHVVGLVNGVCFFDKGSATIVGVQVDHVLALFGRANQTTSDSLLLEVHGKRVELEGSVSW